MDARIIPQSQLGGTLPRETTTDASLACFDGGTA
jgi:hypothetical protein